MNFMAPPRTHTYLTLTSKLKILEQRYSKIQTRFCQALVISRVSSCVCDRALALLSLAWVCMAVDLSMVAVVDQPRQPRTKTSPKLDRRGSSARDQGRPSLAQPYERMSLGRRVACRRSVG